MIKKLWKKKSTKIWVISSAVMVGLAVALPIVVNTCFSNLLDTVFGSPAPIYKKGEQSAFEGKYSSKTESLANANDVNQRINEEGMVLLKNKNNALPIKKGAKVSVFGKNSVNMAIGGSGSGAASGSYIGIAESLEDAGFTVNPVLTDFYKSEKESGKGRTSNPGDLDSGKPVFLETGETPQSSYTEKVKSSYNDYKDVAVVVFTRIGGEGFDLPMTMKGASGARKEDDHFLQLDQNETDLLKAVCEAGFGKVVVVLNSGSPMELGFLEKESYYAYQKNVDAAIWMGYPGNTGSLALGKILSGEVNPSGRTVDTFSTDFKKDPTWNNFSINRDSGTNGIVGDQYVGEDGKGKLYYSVDYEEGVYVGYRYYETRGETDGEDWYKENVVYPFGFGLSYTTFDWEVIRQDTPSEIKQGEPFDITVKVTNTGDVAGKDVVEVYAGLPYIQGQIEKPSEILAGFAKTSLLKPKESEEVTITIDPYYLASYDYKDQNQNGFKGYELDKGTYKMKVSRNAHEVVDTITMNVASTIQYDTDEVTGTEVKNLYTDNENTAFNSDTELGSILSRTDWNGTWPTSPSVAERTRSQEFFDSLDDKSTNNPNDYDNDPEFDYPTIDADKVYELYDLLYEDNLDSDGNPVVDENGDKVRGKWIGEVSYDDDRWETLLDQMNPQEAIAMYNFAAYKVDHVNSVGLPDVACADGPVGWTSFMNAGLFKNCCSYSCGVTVASTWNVDLVEEFGEAVGEEGLVGNGGVPYTGWYAPAMNIHRSPFGGRCFEYYSEDSLLSGKIGAAEVRGTRKTGVVAYVKHFALNEQETHRSISGDCSWVTEQAMREIYLRPFEITVKEGKPLGIMSSFNRIGTRWTGGDYRLLTTILRDEWGFNGSVICDFNTIPTYMDAKQEAYAGGDLNLATMSNASWNWDESSIGDQIVLRRILKNVCYSYVNSNVMKGTVIGRMPHKWLWINYTVVGVFVGAIVVWGAILIPLNIKKIKKEESETK